MGRCLHSMFPAWLMLQPSTILARSGLGSAKPSLLTRVQVGWEFPHSKADERLLVTVCTLFLNIGAGCPRR